MSGVGDERIAVQTLGEEVLAERDGLSLLHLVDAGGEPVPFRRFNNKGGPLVIKAVGVQVEPAPPGFFEIKGEGIKLPAAAQPDKTVLTSLNVGLEDMLVLSASHGRGAVGGDEQIAARRVVIRIGDFRLEEQFHAESGRALLEDLQQLDAGDPTESVAAGGNLTAFKEDINIVPVAEGMRDPGV